MKKNSLSINLIASLVSYGSAIIVNFLLTPYIIENLGRELYSFYGMANSIVSYISIISIALNSMAAKYITVEFVRGNILKSNQYYSSIFYSNVLLSFLLTPLLILIIIFLQDILNISSSYIIEVKILFILVFCTMLMNLISSIVSSATYIKNRIDLKSYTEIGKTFLKVILYLVFFFIFKPSIVYVGIIAVLLEIYTCATQIMIKKRILPELSVNYRFFNKHLVIDSLRIGIWNSINHLGDLMLSSSDLLLSNTLISETASGIISIIKVMPSLLSGVITAINSVFLPRISRVYGKNDIEGVIDEVHLSQRVIGFISTSIVMIMIIFGGDFYNLWIPGNDIKLISELSSIDVSRMMIVGVTWPVVNLNIIMDKTKHPSLFIVFFGLFNIISMYLMISYTKLGIYSIPITTLVLSIAYYGFYIPIYSSKQLGVPYSTFFAPIVEMFASALIIWLVTSLIKKEKISNWFALFLYSGLATVTSLLVSFCIFFKPWMKWKLITERKEEEKNDKENK